MLKRNEERCWRRCQPNKLDFDTGTSSVVEATGRYGGGTDDEELLDCQ